MLHAGPKIIRGLLLTLFLLAMGTGAPWAAPAGKTRIAILVGLDNKPFRSCLSAFKQHLAAGGIDAEFDVYFLNGELLEAIRAVKKIQQDGPALVFALGTLALDQAAKKIRDVPLIAGLVLREESLREWENATGVYLEFPYRVQFEWMRRLLPESRRIGVLFNPEENNDHIRKAAIAAGKQGLKLVPERVDSPRDLPTALDKLTNTADAIWGLSDRVVLNPQTARDILLFSFRNRIPFVGLSAAWVKAGAIYALERDYREIGLQCGEMAQKALAGVPVAKLPPVPPRTVRYVLNLKTARKMRIDFSPSVKAGAEELF